MKGTEIHNGLDKKEIREYLSKALAESYKKGYAHAPLLIVGETASDRAISRLENSIIDNIKLIQIHKDRLAICQIIRKEGWIENDVSEYVASEDGIGYRSFLGTELEYEKLLEELKSLSQ